MEVCDVTRCCFDKERGQTFVIRFVGTNSKVWREMRCSFIFEQAEATLRKNKQGSLFEFTMCRHSLKTWNVLFFRFHYYLNLIEKNLAHKILFLALLITFNEISFLI
jgi:hypothetical protein